MKNNIDTKYVKCRKIIIEIRVVPNPLFLDKRGQLVHEISKANLLKEVHWTIDDNQIRFSDSIYSDQERNVIQIGIRGIAYISSEISSIDNFFTKFNKLFSIYNQQFPDMAILRIGCRIQGVYSTNDKEYTKVLEKFKSLFSNQLFIKDFPVENIQFHIKYPNGQYEVAPIRNNDVFVTNNFPFLKTFDEVGFGLDTDNYIISLNNDLQSIDKIREVLSQSLAVEKNILDRFQGLK